MPEPEQRLLDLALVSKTRLAVLIAMNAPKTIIDNEVRILEHRVTRLATILLTPTETPEDAQTLVDARDAETLAGAPADAPRASGRSEDGCKIRHGLRALACWLAIILGIGALALGGDPGPFTLSLILVLSLISYMGTKNMIAWAEHRAARRQQKNDQTSDQE